MSYQHLFLFKTSKLILRYEAIEKHFTPSGKVKRVRYLQVTTNHN